MSKTTFILAGWLIDGSGGPIQEKVLLRLVDGRIGAIEQFNAETLPEASLVDRFVPLHHHTPSC